MHQVCQCRLHPRGTSKTARLWPRTEKEVRLPAEPHQRRHWAEDCAEASRRLFCPGRAPPMPHQAPRLPTVPEASRLRSPRPLVSEGSNSSRRRAMPQLQPRRPQSQCRGRRLGVLAGVAEEASTVPQRLRRRTKAPLRRATPLAQQPKVQRRRARGGAAVPLEPTRFLRRPHRATSRQARRRPGRRAEASGVGEGAAAAGGEGAVEVLTLRPPQPLGTCRPSALAASIARTATAKARRPAGQRWRRQRKPCLLQRARRR